MTLRLIYSRPMAVHVADDEPRRDGRPSLFERFVRLLFKGLQRSRARAAARELRRYQYLVHNDGDADKT